MATISEKALAALNASNKVVKPRKLNLADVKSINNNHAMEKLPYKRDDIIDFKIKSSDLIVVNNKFKTSKYYAVFDYYPTNRFPDVDQEIQILRKVVWAFKDGTLHFDNLVIYMHQVIINSKMPLENTILIPIPASKVAKTIARYSKLIEPLAKKLNIKNGYNYITAVDHEPTKGHAGGNKIEHFAFHHNPYTGLNVILLDDVRTSGTTFTQTAKRMFELGANSVTGVFLAKTVLNGEDVIQREKGV